MEKLESIKVESVWSSIVRDTVLPLEGSEFWARK